MKLNFVYLSRRDFHPHPSGVKNQEAVDCVLDPIKHKLCIEFGQSLNLNCISTLGLCKSDKRSFKS